MREEETKAEGGGKEEEGKKQEGVEKKEETKKECQGKKEGGGDGGEKKKADGLLGREEEEEEEPPPPPPQPPEEIVMRVFMHCKGCARKVERSLKGFEGVEEVTTDCQTQKVVVKGKLAAADPLKVVARVEKKSGRKVELLTPIPSKPEEKDKNQEEEKEKPEPVERKKELEPPVMCVVLKVHMHCEACSQEIKRRILRMKGVQSVDPDLKSSQVTVKGAFEPPKLVEYVYRHTGKHAAVVKAEPVEKQSGRDEGKGEKKDEGHEAGEDAGGGEEDEGAVGRGEVVDEKTAGDAAAAKLGEVTKNPFFYYYHPKYQQVEYAYPPQTFSDENPNACSVM